MHTTFIQAVAVTLLSGTTIVSATNSSDPYHGISLYVNTNPVGQPATASPAPVELNILTSLNGVAASRITFDTAVAINVNVTHIECRAFRDADGTQPGSAPFNYLEPAYLSTNLVTVGSILCYTVTDDDAARFGLA